MRNDTKFVLSGRILSAGMELRAAYQGNLKLGKKLELTNIELVISVGKDTGVYFQAQLHLTQDKVTFSGTLFC